MKQLSAEETLDLLRRGEEVRDARVSESLSLRDISGECARTPVRFVNCRLGGVDTSFVRFEAPVRFESCSVESLFGMSSYFLAGLVIERCTFDFAVDLSCGGHNRPGHPITVSETEFGDFVNFFGCWFQGPIRVSRCVFKAGTNLLGNHGKPFVVTFDVVPELDSNVGELNIDGS